MDLDVPWVMAPPSSTSGGTTPPTPRSSAFRSPLTLKGGDYFEGPEGGNVIDMSLRVRLEKK